ncbi:MAG: hypothetical protein R3301_19635, partial [Saprospiraceae bacterium]|nr:hypothetical protein [Saprospiraceae bacterium]
MKRAFLVILACGLSWVMTGQYNYIFNGGAGMGFARGGVQSASHNNIFGGAENDGWDAEQHSTAVQNGVYGGGSDDGFDTALFTVQTVSGILAGGTDDGFHQAGVATTDHHGIWVGGADDGFASGHTATEVSSLVYTGGKDDGFDQSGISGTIWTGAISKDWLVASNWHNDIVPTVSHHATIPGDVPRFPELHGRLLIGAPGVHLYTARSVQIAFGAEIIGLEESEVINKG